MYMNEGLLAIFLGWCWGVEGYFNVQLYAAPWNSEPRLFSFQPRRDGQADFRH